MEFFALVGGRFSHEALVLVVQKIERFCHRGAALHRGRTKRSRLKHAPTKVIDLVLVELVGLNLFGKLLVFVFLKKIREQVRSYKRYLPKPVFTTEGTEALRYTEEDKEIAAKARSYKSDLPRFNQGLYFLFLPKRGLNLRNSMRSLVSNSL
ncbi:MAG: hypothetical protein ACPGTQ_05545 [Colwellia sp.]